MNNNRQETYSFRTQKDLIAYFSDIIPPKQIKNIIKKMKGTFIKRPEALGKIEKMQFLKKCEWELVRHVKKITS